MTQPRNARQEEAQTDQKMLKELKEIKGMSEKTLDNNNKLLVNSMNSSWNSSKLLEKVELELKKANEIASGTSFDIHEAKLFFNMMEASISDVAEGAKRNDFRRMILLSVATIAIVAMSSVYIWKAFS